MATLLGLLPAILQILAWVLKWYGASEKTLDAYKELVKVSAASNLISVNMRDRLVGQRDAILERVKAREEALKQEPKP